MPWAIPCRPFGAPDNLVLSPAGAAFNSPGHRPGLWDTAAHWDTATPWVATEGIRFLSPNKPTSWFRSDRGLIVFSSLLPGDAEQLAPGVGGWRGVLAGQLAQRRQRRP